MNKQERLKAARAIALAVERNEVPDDAEFAAEGGRIERVGGGWYRYDDTMLKASRKARTCYAYSLGDYEAYRKADMTLAAAKTQAEALEAARIAESLPASLKNDIVEGVERAMASLGYEPEPVEAPAPAEAPANLTREEQFAELLALEGRAHDLGLEFSATTINLWIAGNTKPIKDELKRLGCRWAKKRQAWYWKVAA